MFNRFFSHLSYKEDVVFSGANFYNHILLDSLSWVDPGFYFLFSAFYIVARVKALILLGPGETVSTKVASLSSLPSRWFQTDFQSLQIPSYSFRPMMSFQSIQTLSCFNHLPLCRKEITYQAWGCHPYKVPFTRLAFVWCSGATHNSWGWWDCSLCLKLFA